MKPCKITEDKQLHTTSKELMVVAMTRRKNSDEKSGGGPKITAVLSKWESANIDFICFANKGVNHRHRKSRPGIPRDSPRFVFQFSK